MLPARSRSRRLLVAAPAGRSQTGATSVAGERRIHDHAAALRMLAARAGLEPLSCAGDGMLVTDQLVGHGDVAAFCAQATRLLGAPVDLVSAAAAHAGRHVCDRVRSAHPL